MSDNSNDDWLNDVEDDDELIPEESTTDHETVDSDPAANGTGGDDDQEPGRVAGTAQTVGGGIAWGIVAPFHFMKVLFVTIFTSVSRKIPFVGKSFWRGMIKWSTRQYQKSAGADVVNFSAEPHGFEPRAANWVEADPDEPDQEPGWQEVSGDKTWGPGAEGRDVERFGKADVIITDRSAHKTATPLKMRFAEALDLEQVDGLIMDPDINQTIVQQWPKDPMEIQNDPQAVADGGTMAQRHEERPVVDPEDLGWDDALVDLASDFRDGKGMRVSARKYKHQKLSSTDAEEMQKQETRGFLAGKAGRDESGLIKLFIIVLVVIGIVAVGPEFVTALFGGGGGGGGGSMLPIWLGLLG